MSKVLKWRSEQTEFFKDPARQTNIARTMIKLGKPGGGEKGQPEVGRLRKTSVGYAERAQPDHKKIKTNF